MATQTRAGKQRPPAGLDAASRLLATSWAPAVIKQWTARLARRVAAPVCTDTALLSNLGAIPDPPSFGDSGTETAVVLRPRPDAPGPRRREP